MGNTSEETLGHCASCGLDFVPFVGNAKGIYEGFSGRDAVTGEDIHGFDRAMCFVGAVPIVGNYAKGASRTARVVRRVSKGISVRNDFHNCMNAGKCAQEIIDDNR